MTEAPQILLNHRLKSLRLPTVLREYGKLAKQAAAVGLNVGGRVPSARRTVGGRG